jgi:membrane protein
VVSALVRRMDAYQQRHRWAGFVFAVAQKFGEDQAGNLAALIAYYAFLSVFPLLLAMVTVLGYVLAGSPELRQALYSSAISQFPLIGQQDPVRPLTGNPVGLVVGLVLAVWSGLWVAQTAQTAINTVYAVPRIGWPALPRRLVRSGELVTVGGLGLVVTTLLQGVVSGGETYGLHIGGVGVVLAALVGIAANTLLFVYLFRRLTVATVTAREAAPGAVVAALAWFALQKVGTNLVNTKVHGAQTIYGTFAVVIGLLFWFYLLANVTLVCAEINVVASRRLWPRGLSSALAARASTTADRRAYSSYPEREHQAHNIAIETRFTPAEPTPAGATPSSATPSSATPSSAVPGGAVPGGAVPGGAVPGGAAPDSPPGGSAPEDLPRQRPAPGAVRGD